MGKGRSNNAMIVIMLLFCMLVFHFEIAHAKVYMVGDAAGWSLYVSNWGNEKNLQNGDIIVFKYNPKVDSVVKVNDIDFASCNASGALAIFKSGYDSIMLQTGVHYFISDNREKCHFHGMNLPIQVF